MDTVLMEKITRLVIEKLEALNREPEHRPLTKEELQRWQEISSSFRQPSIASSYIREPLTNEEINRWNQLTLSDFKSLSNKEESSERVVFYRHNLK